MMKRRILITGLTMLITLTGLAQEVLTGLQVNPAVRQKAAGLLLRDNLTTGQDTTPVLLPFFDDFSANAVFPSPLRWTDRYTFENDDLAVFPVNIGAMTFDAINDTGNMYPIAIPGPTPFIADHLTSRFIRLDSTFTPVARKLTPADSVYLSFFYQPQGRGRAPQKNDSLILEFLLREGYDTIIGTDTIPVPDKWHQAWYSNGMPIDTFYQKNNRWFMQVMVPVTDPVFFKRRFCFRFYNYASLASTSEPSWQSNTSHWNIDNVYLNVGRNRYDSVYPELRFVSRPPSLLKRYESMPYPQYCDDPTNEIRDTLDVLMTNRDTDPHMSTYGYTVSNATGSFIKTYSGGNYNIQPYNISPYVTYQKFAHPALPFLIPIGEEDSATFTVQHIVNAAGTSLGDTMTSLQKFYNYFAYDNGTPEASYGLSQTGSALACKFTLNRSPDTLRAVSFYFNRTLSNASKQFFYLCVWNDNAGKPGDTVYSDLVMPRYADSINHFVTYHLSPPLPITGTFYVGWIQTTGDNLSVGFDRYNNSQNNIFYNAIGTWNNSAFSGSLMIRPIVGKPIVLGYNHPERQDLRLSVFPNPCSTGTIRISLSGPQGILEPAAGTMLTISGIDGRQLIRRPWTGTLDVSGLTPGLYFLEIVNADGTRSGTSKFIITR